MAKGNLNYQYYAHLARRIREGDQDAFAELYESTYPDLYRYVFYFLKEPDAVDDVLQETYISIYRNIGSLKLDQVFLSWIKQIVYHECCDYLRREKYSWESSMDITEANQMLSRAALETEDECFQPVYDRDTARQLRAALDQLPFKERQAFLLRYDNDLKLEQVADFMDVSLATAKRYILRARTALQKSLSYMKETV